MVNGAMTKPPGHMNEIVQLFGSFVASKPPGSRLSQDSRDYFAMHVSQAKISSTVAVGQPFVI
jgi:hypothetical protein